MDDVSVPIRSNFLIPMFLLISFCQGSAAYLTVNLDDMLSGTPVQYREVDGAESKLFLSYFSQLMKVEGGVASGFTSPEPETYETKLLHVSGTGTDVVVQQVPIDVSSLNNKDVFILDLGMKLYQFNSVNCGPFERMAGSGVLEKIVALRNYEPEGINIDGEEVLEIEEFWAPFGGVVELSELPDPPEPEEEEESGIRKLYKVSDEDGSIGCDLVEEKDGENLSLSLIEEDSIMIAVANNEALFYIGSGASQGERFHMNFKTAEILETIGLPWNARVTQVKKDGDTSKWDELFS
uniref:Gelsolin-like domain-containing protein n=1 Tax=Timspurckia oligopyrenoides TaxID=708627 RepID=A0A7S1ERB4_9RHOD|mmetsp:Transcript_1818/g.3244  ORF Transcript_1818/g.3244 Transcript_1818/m.3244 type:complete len:294 (+) Transcript_1818:613-1494(+)